MTPSMASGVRACCSTAWSTASSTSTIGMRSAFSHVPFIRRRAHTCSCVAASTTSGCRSPSRCQSRQPRTAHARIPAPSLFKMSGSVRSGGKVCANGTSLTRRHMPCDWSRMIGFSLTRRKNLATGSYANGRPYGCLALIVSPPVPAQPRFHCSPVVRSSSSVWHTCERNHTPRGEHSSETGV